MLDIIVSIFTGIYFIGALVALFFHIKSRRKIPQPTHRPTRCAQVCVPPQPSHNVERRIPPVGSRISGITSWYLNETYMVLGTSHTESIEHVINVVCDVTGRNISLNLDGVLSCIESGAYTVIGPKDIKPIKSLNKHNFI